MIKKVSKLGFCKRKEYLYVCNLFNLLIFIIWVIVERIRKRRDKIIILDVIRWEKNICIRFLEVFVKINFLKILFFYRKNLLYYV